MSPEGRNRGIPRSTDNLTYTIMDNYTAVAIAEGFEEAQSEEQLIEAWQYLVDTGLAYSLQGWFGRQAEALIEAGIINRRRA